MAPDSEAQTAFATETPLDQVEPVVVDDVDEFADAQEDKDTATIDAETQAQGASEKAAASSANTPAAEKTPEEATTSPKVSPPFRRSPSPPSPFSVPKAALTVSAAHLDDFLLHLNRCMATPAGIDTVLGTLCYGSRLVAAIVTAPSARRTFIQEPYRQLVALAALVRPPGAGRPELLLLSSAVPPSAPPRPTARAAAALELAKRLRALGSLMTEARMILRLWGLLSMYVWARQMVKQLWAASNTSDTSDTSSAPKKKSKAEAVINWTQLVSCIVYQVLENGAYLSGRGILGWSPAAQGRAYRWSSRSFAVFVVTELARMAVQLARNLAPGRAPATAEQKLAAQTLHEDMVRYASLAPMTAQWGSERSLLSEGTMATLGFVSAAINMRRLWNKT